ncbi:MAG TPA: YkgJ family cysteine cluster protein [Bacillota bacterium]
MLIEINHDLLRAFDGLPQLMAVYSELDTLISDFKRKTGIDCLPGCKKCCGTAGENIEVSVFEVLPVSIYFWQNGQAEQWLKKLETTTPAAPCVLYNDNPQAKSGCHAYSWRPLLCRLFGFSAKLDKRGKPLIGLCKELKRHEAFLEKRVQEWIDRADGAALLPINSHFAQKITALNPHLGQRRSPINAALKEALEMVGFRIALLTAAERDPQQNPPEGRPPRGPQLGKSA